MIFPDPLHREVVRTHGLAPLRFVDDSNQVTERYPMNPNGSEDGIAALCSQDGRHLAMMPHPERCHLTWQMPHMPNDWRPRGEGLGLHPSAGPWLKMFQNAREWCDLTLDLDPEPST